MATLVQPLNDILTLLTAIQVTNQDSQVVPLYARIWNNQIKFEKDKKLYSFPRPAAFVEIVSPATFEVLLQGYRSCDIGFKIHLTHENYNAEGSFEQDLAIFALRDTVIQKLTGQKISGCGPLEAMHEYQDYEHSNVYHYIIDFVCNFTDSTGAIVYTESVPPTELEVDIVTPNNTKIIIQDTIETIT